MADATIVYNSVGVPIFTGPAYVYDMNFGHGFRGNYSLTKVGSYSDLCSSPSSFGASSLSGMVVLAGDFYAAGCSYEARARGAQARNATGILYEGSLHSPFDWDGSDRSGLGSLGAAFAWTYGDFYSDIDAALDNDGQTIHMVTSPTPLLDTGFQIFQWILAGIVHCVCVCSISAGGLRMYQLHGDAKMTLSRVTICLEMLSQTFLLVRELNGPGYDLTHPVSPHRRT